MARAKRYAARTGTSVSRLVDQFLALVSGAASRHDEDFPPILSRLRAEMKGVKADATDHKRYLERKYR